MATTGPPLNITLPVSGDLGGSATYTIVAAAIQAINDAMLTIDGAKLVNNSVTYLAIGSVDGVDLIPASVPAAALAAEPWTGFTPALYQGASVAYDLNVARYKNLGKIAIVQLRLQAVANGTGGSPVTIQLPEALTFKSYADDVVGSGMVRDTYRYGLIALATGATTVSFYCTTTALVDYIGVEPGFTLSNGAVISALLAFELA